ncbi:MAG TPA: alpha/beta hydrolase [Pyrinomonadaceae bacterium]|nr:alpha/beta hydrolase [Pyrinomonadaceae bacterium]
MSENLASLESSIRHGYAQVGGVRLHYAERGNGPKLVVLLHGFPECWYSWRHQMMALGDRFTVVAPDMRGYNLSDKPPRVADYRIDLLVDDVLGLIRHFGAREAVVVGHDWGAGIAWAVAQRNPEYVSKLVTMQVPPAAAWRANLTWRQALRSWYMLFFQIPRLPEWLMKRNDYESIEKTFKDTVGRRGSFSDADIAVYKQAMREPRALTSAINYYRANFVPLFFKRSGAEFEIIKRRVTVPTLFIYGEKDFAIVPETVRGVERFIDAPYKEVRIPGSGHWVQNEAVAEVNAALNEFLDEA